MQPYRHAFLAVFLSITFFLGSYTPHLEAQNLNNVFRSKLEYPGQTMANVWGYVSRGREYALVGGSKGLIIVDITNPETPNQLVQIPGPDNLWKEIKTYRTYAYVVSEGGGGIQIVNLKDLPSATLQSKFYTGDGPIAGQLGTIHALHIDETKGFLYAWGGSLFGGGAKIFDLKQDPWNPVYVGKFSDLGYIHDGYVDNDTMYSSHIYAGQFAVVNMADKSSPELINTQTTPNAFTHNTWLTNDRHTILATDERNNSYLSAWDVSDPTDIKFLDQIQSNPGSGSMVHNTYVRENWAITSWYKDGFTIVDITRPDNLIQVGNYDTFSGGGGGSEGCWGVYHNFPSGNIIASNINVGGKGELWVITPEYVRACYLEGKVTDASTGFPIFNAQISIQNSNPFVQEASATNGTFKTGLEKDGYYWVTVTKPGYQDFEAYVFMQHGELVFLEVALFPVGSLNVQGTVVHHNDGLPVAGATVWLYGDQTTASTVTDVAGTFEFDNIIAGKYDLAATSPDLSVGQLVNQMLVRDTSLEVLIYSTFRRPTLPGNSGSWSSTKAALQIGENPFTHTSRVRYHLNNPTGSLAVVDAVGKTVQMIALSDTDGDLELGAEFPSGLYFVVLRQDNEVVEIKKIIKQ